MVIDKYYSDIEKLIDVLNSVKALKYDGILIYGSAYNEKLFSKNSDIDLLVMCKDFDYLDLNEICKNLESKNLDFKEKNPMIIDDIMCKRIEFYVKFDKIKLDVTICPGLIPTSDTLIKNAWYDYFESLMGGVYLRNKIIYGSIPDIEIFKKYYYPFYDEELRENRLNVLVERLQNINNLLHYYIDTNNPDIFDYINKYKKYFIKFLFIYYRTYSWTPEKHIHYQLSEYLNLSEQEINTICFIDGNIKNLIHNYVDLVDHYLSNYYDEKKLIRKRKV